MMSEQATTNPDRDISREVVDISRRIEQIVTIRQVGGSYRCEPSLAANQMRVQLIEAPARVEQSGAKLVAVLDFAFIAIQPEEAGDEIVADVRATFEIQYRLKDEDVIDDEALVAFGNINGRFNLTSYWREFLATTLTRAGMTAYIAQPMNAAARLQKLKEQSRKQVPDVPETTDESSG